MIELKISGENGERFAHTARELIQVLAHGIWAEQPPAPAVEPAKPTVEIAKEALSAPVEAEVEAENKTAADAEALAAINAVTPAPARRGRPAGKKANPPEVIEKEVEAIKEKIAENEVPIPAVTDVGKALVAVANTFDHATAFALLQSFKTAEGKPCEKASEVLEHERLALIRMAAEKAVPEHLNKTYGV